MSEEQDLRENLQENQPGEQNDLEGIGGWLILLAIGMVVTPIRIVMLIGSTYPEIFSSGIWEVLTTPGADAYQPLWGPIIIVELSINIGLMVAWIYMGFRFFTKSREFPKWYVGIAIFSLLFILVDAFAVKLVLPNEPVFDPDTVQELARSVFMVIIWAPYVLLSKRAKATFVN